MPTNALGLWKNVFFAALLLGFADSALAQIEVQLRIEPRKVLLHESIMAYVDIGNNTSDAISIGGRQANANLEFVIRDMNGNYVSKRADRGTLADPTVIEPFKSGSIAIDITTAYDLNEARPYKARSIIDWRGNTFSSGQTYFDVMPGNPIASKTFGMSDENDNLRKYTLLYLYRDGKAQLFMRIENIEGSVCYGVYNFGDYIRIQDAQMKIDNRGLIHLLFQSGPRRFSYYILDSSMETEKKMFYAGTANKIELLRTSAGEVFVEGGQKYEGDTYTEPYEFKQNRIFE